MPVGSGEDGRAVESASARSASQLDAAALSSSTPATSGTDDSACNSSRMRVASSMTSRSDDESGARRVSSAEVLAIASPDGPP